MTFYFEISLLPIERQIEEICYKIDEFEAQKKEFEAKKKELGL